MLFRSDRRPEPGAALAFETPVLPGDAAVPVVFPSPVAVSLPIEAPSALACPPEGGVYVAGKTVVVRLDAEGVLGRRYAVAQSPRALACDGPGRLYLAFADRVGALDTASGEVRLWERLGGNALLTSLACDGTRVYAADAGNRVVHCFGVDGVWIRDLGASKAPGSGEGFVVPSPYLDVAFDAQGALWAVNPGRHGLEQYREDGVRVSQWYRPGMTPDAFCGCCNPVHIAFGPDNVLYTAEKGLVRIKAFGPDTKLLGYVAPPGFFSGPEYASWSNGEETAVADLGVDACGRVLALDAARGRLLIFAH